MFIQPHVYRRSNKNIKRLFAIEGQLRANQLLYAMGRKKPNYPVPAIRRQIYIQQGPNGNVKFYWNLTTGFIYIKGKT
jgi:hypothetical protein